MAHLEPMGLDALDQISKGLKGLEAETEEVAKKCINKASPIGERAYKGAMTGTGGLPARVALAVDTLKAKENFWGIYTVSRAVGTSPTTGTRYAAIAAYYNYGAPEHYPYRNTSGKKISIQATHWFDAAVSAAEGPVTESVNKTFDREVKRLIKLAT